MPEANRFLYSHRELAEMMVREAGIHEGKWMLLAEMNFGAANLGQGEDVNPGGMLIIKKMGIQRVPEGEKYPESLTVDAARINPAA
ncbi:MAG: hypothetical protein OEZ59_09420 [Deltaproteobacteria bacterium]|nr:hypothetical protein [Deltaproteobacteria bacterium]